ncbi:MAG: glutathione S-transferase family protein [Pseudomonadota bacterium]
MMPSPIAEPGLILHDFALDLAGYTVRLAASLVGKPLTVVDVDKVPGEEHLSDALLDLNPLATLPILRSGDDVLCEPGAMVLHLCDGTPFAAESTKALDWAVTASALLSLFNQTRHELLFSQSRPIDDEAFGLARSQISARIRTLEDYLSFKCNGDQLFLLGDGPSAADLLAFPAFAQSRDLGIEPEPYPALRLWARRIRALPGFIGMPGIPDYH